MVSGVATAALVHMPHEPTPQVEATTGTPGSAPAEQTSQNAIPESPIETERRGDGDDDQKAVVEKEPNAVTAFP